ncbi:MAG: dihydrofolate reductase family protein [Burkholderiaceae bacterium]
MRKLAILVFQTLDGVMQAPSSPAEDNSSGFAHGGWAGPYWDEVMGQVTREAMADPYDLLLGRTTYDIFAASMRDADSSNATAQRLNRARKYVVTTHPSGLDWQNTVHVSGHIPAQIRQLKEQNGPLLQVHGSWQLIQLLLQNRLIDEFRLWTFPVILGAGKRLFADGSSPQQLTLVKQEATGNGVIMTILR